MLQRLRDDWRPEHAQLFAQVSCLCLGLALAAWGLAPAVMERILTGHAPSLEAIAVRSMTLLTGVAFIGLHVLIRHDVAWALWSACALSSLMLLATLLAVLLGESGAVSIFPLFLASCTAFSTWLARAATARKSEGRRPTE